jgi:archaellum component FlaC
MGLGGTAKKLQKVTEMAEDVYTRLNDLRDQVIEMRETTQETKERVDRLERESAEMRALLEALAEEQGIDVESVSADAHIFEAEASDEESAADEGTAEDETAADSSSTATDASE